MAETVELKDLAADVPDGWRIRLHQVRNTYGTDRTLHLERFVKPRWRKARWVLAETVGLGSEMESFIADKRVTALTGAYAECILLARGTEKAEAKLAARNTDDFGGPHG